MGRSIRADLNLTRNEVLNSNIVALAAGFAMRFAVGPVSHPATLKSVFAHISKALRFLRSSLRDGRSIVRFCYPLWACRHYHVGWRIVCHSYVFNKPSRPALKWHHRLLPRYSWCYVRRTSYVLPLEIHASYSFVPCQVVSEVEMVLELADKL